MLSLSPRSFRPRKSHRLERRPGLAVTWKLGADGKPDRTVLDEDGNIAEAKDGRRFRARHVTRELVTDWNARRLDAAGLAHRAKCAEQQERDREWEAMKGGGRKLIPGERGPGARS